MFEMHLEIMEHSGD